MGCATLIVGLGWWRGRSLLQWARVALAWPSGFIGLITIIVLLAAALAEAIGIHAIFGAFFVGVALRRAFGQDDQHVHAIIYQFAISFFAPLYFVSIGLKADFAAHFDLPLVLIVFDRLCWQNRWCQSRCLARGHATPGSAGRWLWHECPRRHGDDPGLSGSGVSGD